MENNVARKPKTDEVKMIDDPTEAINPGLDPVPEAAPEVVEAPVAEAVAEPVVEAAPEPVVVEIVTAEEAPEPKLSKQTLLEMETGRKALAARAGN